MKEIIVFITGFFTAIFAEPLRRWIFRPRLIMDFGDTNDFKADTPEIVGTTDGTIRKGRAYYIRGRVVNKSTNIAKQCRVYLTNIEKKSNRTGEFEQTTFCEGIPLHWSCRELGGAFNPLDLPKDINQYFDIFSTREGDTNIDPKLMSKPFRYEHLFTEPGTYRYSIQVSGEGFRPIVMKILLEWKGVWDDFIVKKEDA